MTLVRNVDWLQWIKVKNFPTCEKRGLDLKMESRIRIRKWHNADPQHWYFIYFSYITLTLQRHYTNNLKKYSQKYNLPASFPIPTFMFRWAIYIFPRSVCLFCCRRIRGQIVGIYKSLTDSWMLKLEGRGRAVSFWGKHNSAFLCSVQTDLYNGNTLQNWVCVHFQSCQDYHKKLHNRLASRSLFTVHLLYYKVGDDPEHGKVCEQRGGYRCGELAGQRHITWILQVQSHCSTYIYYRQNLSGLDLSELDYTVG
jgi:hypothetical protein